MLVIGLTGSIGMGKSTASERFRSHGIAVFDADAEVHRLYSGAAVPEIERAFPGVTDGKTVDREKLSAALMERPQRFTELEKIVHPLVREAERAFLKSQLAAGAGMAVLEIPLLFEAGVDRFVDAVVVVSAADDEQRRRVLKRPGMTRERLDSLLARQLPDAEKRARAEFVVDTNGPIANSYAQIDTIIAILGDRKGHAYHRHWRRR